MNPKKMVKISNTIGLIAVLALLYWFITSAAAEIFGLSIIQTVTQTFSSNISGIFTVLLGVLIVNVMFNFSRIADKISGDAGAAGKKTGIGIIVFICTLPLLIGGLFLGNSLSVKKAEKELITSADGMVRTYRAEIEQMSNYTFSRNWVANTASLLSLMTRLGHNDIAVIVEDEINESTVYLTFDELSGPNDRNEYERMDFVKRYSPEEREYFKKVFGDDHIEKYFASNKGAYQLFVPYENDDKKIILFFTDKKRI